MADWSVTPVLVALLMFLEMRWKNDRLGPVVVVSRFALGRPRTDE